ncbi:LysR family transcriptional regulator [Paraglaciecola sp. 2405UD69-4]|uniref:LysR family transcriptional regulator n=1 Tax=Paraglaciecola sp. 2405UD69-4 TaxID=3391836 RepID=UPI0039C97D0D
MGPNVSFKQLNIFVCIANSHTFAEAAEKIHLSQPALSSAMKKMEGQVGGELFFRTTRKVELTPEGKLFLPIAKRLILDWQQAFSDLNDLFSLGQGRLSIAAMPSFAAGLLPSILQRFTALYPSIKLAVNDVVMEHVIQNVQGGHAELGFSFESEKMEGLEFHALFEDSFMAVAHSSHPLTKFEGVSWPQLAKFPFVAMNRGSAIRRWIDELMENKNYSLNIVAEASQLATLGQFVNYELGVSVVPALCREQMLAKKLVCLPIKDSGLKKQVGIIRLKKSNLSSVAQGFWSWVVEQVSEELDAKDYLLLNS